MCKSEVDYREKGESSVEICQKNYDRAKGLLVVVVLVKDPDIWNLMGWSSPGRTEVYISTSVAGGWKPSMPARVSRERRGSITTEASKAPS